MSNVHMVHVKYKIYNLYEILIFTWHMYVIFQSMLHINNILLLCSECDVSLIAYVYIHIHNIQNVMWSLWLLTFTSTDGESIIAWCTLVTFLSLHPRSTRTLPGSLVTLGVDRPQTVTLTRGAPPPRIQTPGILLKETRNPKWKILMAFATWECYFDSKKYCY